MDTLHENADALKKRVEYLEEKLMKMQLVIDGLTKPIAKPKYERPKDDGKIAMNVYKKGILVTGSTFSIKHTLQENGGKWNKSLGGWLFTKSHLDEVIEAIKEEEDIELTVGEGVIVK